MVDAVGARVAVDGLRPVVPMLAIVAVAVAVGSAPGSWWQNLIAVAAIGPFAVWTWVWRGMPPVLLAVVSAVAGGAAMSAGELEPVLFLLCVAGFVIGGWERSPRGIVAGVIVVLGTPAAIELIFPDEVLWGVWVMGIGLSLLSPLAFRRQIDLVAQLAAAREELNRQAAAEEKRAIARDVHDLVGHGLAAVLLHVTGARHLLRRDPDAADEALADAETVGRRSLQELRRTLGVLRAGDAADAPTAPPLPGAGDLAAAVDTARAAGLDVAFKAKGDIDGLDPVVGLSVHRVAEEALANALQHAPRAVTDVELLVEEDTVTLTVESIGPLRDPDPGDADRAHYGIVGMRERVAAVGGELLVGPTATGWRVRCLVPVEEAAS